MSASPGAVAPSLTGTFAFLQFSILVIPLALRRDADSVLSHRRTKILELKCIELNPWPAKYLADKESADNIPDGESIRIRGLIEMIGGNQTTGSGHILHNDRGIARNMLPHISSDCAGIDIESSARGKSYDDPNSFSLVKVMRSAYAKLACTATLRITATISLRSR